MISISNYALLVLTVLMIASGQILFKVSANRIELSEDYGIFRYLDPVLIFALILYAVATMMWIYVLRKVPLNVAYPFMSLSFVIVPTLSWLLLKENPTYYTFLGGVVIFAGMLISSIR